MIPYDTWLLQCNSKQPRDVLCWASVLSITLRENLCTEPTCIFPPNGRNQGTAFIYIAASGETGTFQGPSPSGLL